MFSTAFLVSRGFFNDLLTAKQYGLEICALFGMVLLALTLPFKKQIKFTKADGLVVLFVLWHLLSELLSDAPYSSYSKTLFNTLLWSLIYVFVRQQTAGSLFQWGGVSLFLLIALGQAGLGLMQLYGFSPSHHALFSITGTFHNPGPFSGFVASALPMALGIIAFPTLVMDASKTINANHPVLLSVFIKSLSLDHPYAVAFVLPPAQSRAAWIAGTVGCLFVLTCHPVFKSFWHSLKKASFLLNTHAGIVLACHPACRSGYRFWTLHHEKGLGRRQSAHLAGHQSADKTKTHNGSWFRCICSVVYE